MATLVLWPHPAAGPLMRLVLSAILAAVLAFAGAGVAGAANPVFQVTYGSGMIYVTANGTAVGVAGAPAAVIAPGTYDVNVVDSGGFPAFQLSGPGVNVLATQSPTTVTVTFQPSSTYFFQDANDENATYRTFVTSGPATPVTASPKGGAVSNSSVVGSDAGSSVVGTLETAVAPSGSLSLTDKGAAITRLPAGRYRLVARDPSSKSGFALHEGKRLVTVTSAAFVGRRSLDVTLVPGRWTLSALGKTKSFLVVKD